MTANLLAGRFSEVEEVITAGKVEDTLFRLGIYKLSVNH